MSTPDAAPWWDRYPSELPDALAAFRARGWVILDLDRRQDLETVVVRLAGLGAGPAWLDVTFGPGYPTVAPVLQGPQGPEQHVHLRDGTLCLPGTLDVQAAVEAAIELYVLAEDDPAAVAALGPGAAEPRSEYMGSTPGHSLLLPVEPPPGRWGSGTFAGRVDRTSLRGWVQSMTSEPGWHHGQTVTTDLNDALLESVSGAAHHIDFLWVRLPDRTYPIDPEELLKLASGRLPSDASAMRALLYEDREFPKLRGGFTSPPPLLYGLVVPEEGPEPGRWGEQLLLIVDRGGAISAVVAESIAGAWTRVPERGALAGKTVGVAGLGMLGGHVALDLARTGLGALRLLDPEAVAAGNLLRQPYQVRDLGRPKVEALRRHVREAAPWTRILPGTSLRHRIGSLNGGELRDWINGCDLLVLTTGDVAAEMYVTNRAQEVDVPVICAWVGLGVRGAAVLTTRWGRSGCRWCLEQRYDLVKLDEDSHAAAVFARGCGHPTFAGNVIDGHLAAAAVGRSALNVLGAVEPPGDLAILSFGVDGNVSGPATTWHHLEPDPDCPICSRCA